MAHFHRMNGTFAILLAALVALAPRLPAADEGDAVRAASEKVECQKHLRAIYEAIQSYRHENKELPNWLSDLVPKHLPDTNQLICPVTKRTGERQEAYTPDPKLTTSYAYEFRAGEMGFLWGGGNITMREWKRAQMGLIGDEVPLIRCLNHGETTLNMSFGGKIWESGLQWEDAFTTVVNIEDFSPENLLKPRKTESGQAAAAGPKSDAAFDALTPAQQVAALATEYQTAQRDFNRAYSKAKTDDERKKVVADSYPKPEKFANRFMAVAARAPDDPAAIDALVWVVTKVRFGDEANQAVAVLLDKHIKSEKLKEVAEVLPDSGNPKAEKLLRQIMEKSPHRNVQGQACYSLAALMLGESKNEKEADRLFNLVIDKFGDLPYGDGTLAKAARGDLFELHNLAIGREAPDISGEDVDGKEFKLSDYRGKVVVIDFWGDW